GSLSIECSNTFEIEQFMAIDFATLPAPRELTASFGRWAATDPRAGTALAFAGILFALNSGKLQCIACAKPRLIKYLQEHLRLPLRTFNLPLRPLARDRKFFVDTPQPVFYTWTPGDWHDLLKGKLHPSIIIQV